MTTTDNNTAQAACEDDTDERDDLHGGDLRPWTSRAAWAEEMFDRWAA